MTTKSHTECEECNGLGYILKDVNGYLTAVECHCHKAKRIKAALLTSGINAEEYELKNLDTFIADNPMAEKMKDNAERFLSDPNARGIGFFGKSGIGKTHICIAICQELTKEKGLIHKYFPYKSEMQKLKASFYDAEDYERLMSRWVNCDVLYIDDLLKFALGKDGIRNQDLEITYDIINTRYLNRAMTIFSSEYSLAEITDIDEALGSRIFSMIHPYGVKCEGENRRFSELQG